MVDKCNSRSSKLGSELECQISNYFNWNIKPAVKALWPFGQLHLQHQMSQYQNICDCKEEGEHDI